MPEFSEERVLTALEDGIEMQRSVVDAKQIKIIEITASCRYHPSAVRLCVCVCDIMGAGWSVCLQLLAPYYEI